MALIDTSKGLTADDRSDLDNTLITLQGNDYDSPVENKPKKKYKYNGVEYNTAREYLEAVE
jgi:hypothetical protein